MIRARIRRAAWLAFLASATPIPTASAQAPDSNAQIFAAICAMSIGFDPLDPTTCGQRVPLPFDGGWVSGDPTEPATFESLIANALAGNRSARLVMQAGFTGGVSVPLVVLNRDPCDRFVADGQGGCTEALANEPNPAWDGLDSVTLNESLTDEQEALLGCGPLWGTDCEVDGIDLANAEASVLVQSWPGFERASVATRFVNGEIVIRPGARGPADPGYDPLEDGCVVPDADPLCASAQPLPIPGNNFESELAAASWNFLMTLVAMSAPVDGAPAADDQFDPALPYRTGDGLCSFAQPQFCASVAALLVPEPSATLAAAAALGLLALFRRRR